MAKKYSSRTHKSHRPSRAAIGVAAARPTSAARPAALERLEVFIGRWITEGETSAGPNSAPTRIVASDVYEWAPGGHFVMHPAYGRIGQVGVGGLEVIGYDPSTDQFRTHFFDSQGNVMTETLSCREGTWIWQGEHVRCTGVFSEGGTILTARHEHSEDGIHWVPSMTVTLRKVDYTGPPSPQR
jgi:Protein of unknown function (DUF1579)